MLELPSTVRIKIIVISKWNIATTHQLFRSHHVSVEQALQKDTARLEQECFAYREAATRDQQRTRRAGLEQSKPGQALQVTNAQKAFEDEIAMLEEACRASETELECLEKLLREQMAIKQELDETMRTAAEERNTLLWNAKTFDEEQTQLSRDLTALQAIEETLSSSFHLTASVVSLKVDKHRGLRYPLLNGLRLAYRPKGDLQWNEVQAAWSLAGHLLFSMGTIFEVSGQQWRLVPLSDCVKLFYYPTPKGNDGKVAPVIFNLGHPETNSSKAILTWNAALSQTIQHARTVLKLSEVNQTNDQQRPPYDISPTTIGNLVLPKLSADDDSSWAMAIHYMASNLLWLSRCADVYLQDKVGTLVSLNSTKDLILKDEARESEHKMAK